MTASPRAARTISGAVVVVVGLVEAAVARGARREERREEEGGHGRENRVVGERNADVMSDVGE